MAMLTFDGHRVKHQKLIKICPIQCLVASLTCLVIIFLPLVRHLAASPAHLPSSCRSSYVCLARASPPCPAPPWLRAWQPTRPGVPPTWPCTLDPRASLLDRCVLPSCHHRSRVIRRVSSVSTHGSSVALPPSVPASSSHHRESSKQHF